RELSAPCGLTSGERVLLEVMRVLQMIDVRQEIAGRFAVAGNPADGHAAEVHAVIATLAPDQPTPRAFAARAMVRESDLERGVDGLGAGIGEEDIVEIARRECLYALRNLERSRLTHL